MVKRLLAVGFIFVCTSIALMIFAPMESFFGTLKTESLHHYRFTTREQARQTIFEYIEVFYNRIRRHAKIAIKYLPISLSSFTTTVKSRHNPDDLPVH